MRLTTDSNGSGLTRQRQRVALSTMGSALTVSGSVLSLSFVSAGMGLWIRSLVVSQRIRR